MKFCKINLSLTKYILLPNASILENTELVDNVQWLQKIYRMYCQYKQFESVMPLFPSMLLDKNVDVIGYYSSNKLCAFSIIKKYDTENAESMQFAWDYTQPELMLGYRSIEHECAYYKQKGFKYLYLGEDAKYKSKFDGYEVLGPLYD